MEEWQRRRVTRGLVNMGLIEMKPTGQWGLTPDGRDFLDQLEVLRELKDGRPDAVEQSGAATPTGGSARSGDDVGSARGARRKRTKGGRHS